MLGRFLHRRTRWNCAAAGAAMTDRPPTPPPWWAVPPDPDCGPVILLSQRQYEELKRKKREEQEAAHAAARRKAKSEASMERRARRKGAVPPRFSPRRRGRPAITFIETRRLSQKVDESDLCERRVSCRLPTRRRERDEQRIAQDPERAAKGACSVDTVKRHVRALQNETDPHLRRAFLDDPLLAPLLDGDFAGAESCAGLLNRQLLSGSSPKRLMTKRE